MKKCFLMAAFLAGALQAAIEISAQQAAALFFAIEHNSFQHVDQFFRRLSIARGEEAVVTYANIRNSEGQTPLHLARGPEMFETLLLNGADLGATDSQGRLPLLGICLRNDTELFRSILRVLCLRLRTTDNDVYDRAVFELRNNLDAVLASSCLTGIRLQASELSLQIVRQQVVLNHAHDQIIRDWIDDVRGETQNQTDLAAAIDNYDAILSPSSSSASM